MTKQILIVDDHPAIRMAVRIVLESEGYVVVGESDNGAAALLDIHRLRPEIIILDIGLPNIDGLTIINRLMAQNSKIKLIVLTAQESNNIIARCLQAGAHGFVNKNNTLNVLLHALQSVRDGYHFFPKRSSAHIRREETRVDEETLLRRLSDRELAVLQKLTIGMNNKQIAENLHLSEKTISTYKSRLMDKLNTRNLLELYDIAKRNGLTRHTAADHFIAT